MVAFINFLLFTLLFPTIYCEKTMSIEDDFREKKQIYTEMNNELKQLVRQGIKGLMLQMMDAGKQMNLSSDCMGNLFKLVAGIRDLKIWALSFPDACGKLPDGFMSGNNVMLGNYDQCLASTAKTKNGNIDFRGRYCFLQFQPHLPDLERVSVDDRIEKMKLITENITDALKMYILKSAQLKDNQGKYGLCVPSGCDRGDVEKMTNYVGERIYLKISPIYCHVEADTYKMNNSKIIIIAIFTLLGVLGIVGSIVDYCLKENKNKSTAAKYVLCFAVTKNFPKLIDTKSPELTCISGIRVLTLFHIILGHEYFTKGVFFSQTNFFPYFMAYADGLFLQIVMNGVLSVEVFFFLSGFLNSYIRLKHKELSNSCKHMGMILIHRLWRIYPALIVSIFVTLLLTSRGPMSHFLEESFINNCYTEWWKNILFINNFFPPYNVCVAHFWFVAVDMQLFILSLITVPLLIRRPNIGVFANLTIILAGMLSTGLLSYLQKIMPALVLYKTTKGSERSFMMSMFSPLPNAAPYFLGIIMGYALSRKKDWKISKTSQIIGWCISSVMFTTVLFMPMRWNRGIPYTAVESAFYFSLSRALYVIPVGWLLFCCITRHGGIINYILSLKIWIPLARLSYMLYLVHEPVQNFYHSNKRTTTDFHPAIAIWEYFGTLCVSSLLSLALVVLVESPLIAMEKMIFKREKHENNTNDIGSLNNAEKSEKENSESKQEVKLDIISNGKECTY